MKVLFQLSLPTDTLETCGQDSRVESTQWRAVAPSTEGSLSLSHGYLDVVQVQSKGVQRIHVPTAL